MVNQIVTCFQLSHGESNLVGGSFQVTEELKSNRFYSNEGGVLLFSHCYRNNVCSLDVRYERAGSCVATQAIEIPINRTKIKWRKVDMESDYQLYYRSGAE